MSGDVLSQRTLSRATLARQLLLARSTMPVLDAVAHLVGMQAQVPLNPYTGLWSRLERFDPDELSRLLVERQVVRIVVMRGTIHLVTADDCLVLRPLAQPVLDAELTRHSEYAAPLKGVDIEPVLRFVVPFVNARPRTGTQLRKALAEKFPEHNAAALAYACRNHLALVQVPPRGVWGRGGPVAITTAEAWLGRPLAGAPAIHDVALRYFGAFGPATVADLTAWSRLTGLREIVERLRPQLRVFNDERGRELFDVPDAPRPDPDTPAPPRFLPEYDNVLLSYADRSRFIPEEQRALLFGVKRRVQGSVLHDGTAFGTWRVETGDTDGTVILTIDHLGRPTKKASAAVEAEGRRLMRFLDTNDETRDHDVRLLPLA